jgi:cobalt-precorrin 5A hydrolase / precorrin-3B C17-methyltransferase
MSPLVPGFQPLKFLSQPYPRVLWVGVGCKRGTSKQLIETAIWMVCRSNNLATNEIAGIATVDLKANELGLVAFCQEYQLPLKTFSAEVLSRVLVPTASTVVDKVVKTPSVSEAAAIMAANGVLRVTKQIIRSEYQLGAVTVAIAESE